LRKGNDFFILAETDFMNEGSEYWVVRIDGEFRCGFITAFFDFPRFVFYPLTGDSKKQKRFEPIFRIKVKSVKNKFEKSE
jgi:hypothetical protein